ncbi:hypothetical protein MRS44_003853 [Fusarium solani]|uniref:uncharacterized protein n=1 Tax=Fusarium solani TaxID=169388 RepID=UPI0032C3EE9D|nr:hypothetical protein MRS44_003853 [Fusarium solani]
MTRRIPSCRGITSPDQSPTPREEPDSTSTSTIRQIPFTPGAGLTRESSQPPPSTNPAGIKREQYGQPGTHAPNQRFRGSRSSLYRYNSEDDPDNISSTSGSDSDDSSCSDSEHSSPDAAQECVDLRSIEDVIRHLRRHHMKPPYCPRCSQTFDTLSSRDSHILERTCELLDPQPIQGINFYQKSKLKRRDKIYLGEAERWRCIYATAFPKSDPAYSPYLDRGYGKAVSMARDYWRANGRLFARQFLEHGKFVGEEEERDKVAEDALCKSALEDMLYVIVERYGDRWEDFDS